MADVQTPHTDAGNATFMTNGHNLEEFSTENSFIAPSKNDNLLPHMRNGRGLDLRTPCTRNALAERRSLPNGPKHGEFTPLLKSVAKRNLNQGNMVRGIPQTPAFLKDGFTGGGTPVLPGTDPSGIYADETGSLAGADDEGTPMPVVANSSAQSTPLALPQRDAGGVLTAEGNALTLREQENIINKIEKENFGLKLKIHFLDETLKKAGPGYNATALKENTDLKVDKITMQKELAQARKTLIKTERELEQYRLHLQEAQKNIQRKHIDEDQQRKLESLRASLAVKDQEIARLRQRASAADSQEEKAEKLQGDIEDLEADLREKDRLVEDREDELDRLREQVQMCSDQLAQKENQLEEEKCRTEDIQEDQEEHASLVEKLKETQEDLKEALGAKQKAETELEELQDEMSDKSFHTKGLSRHLEDKANKVQNDLGELRDKHTDLQTRFDEKSQELERALQSSQSNMENAENLEQRLRDQNELLSHDHEIATRTRDALMMETRKLSKELQDKTEDKDLLHSRHDALTTESQNLQKDLTKARSKIQELEENLSEEKQHALDNESQLRDQAKREIDRLSSEVDSLHRDLEDKFNQHDADQDRWESQQRELESQKERADDRAAGLQRTVNELQRAEGSLSDRETRLQQALESEKQHHRSEIAVFERQIRELKSNVEGKRQALKETRSELTQTREELRTSIRDQATYQERIQGMEDEIEVLQTNLEEETQKAHLEIQAAQQEADSLRFQLRISKENVEYAEAAQGSSQDLSRLRKLNAQLATANSEKQSLQDRLASISLEQHSLKTTFAEAEAERDEMKCQLQQMQNRVDDTSRLDQEKRELQMSKVKLESDMQRLREERKGLLERNKSLERELEAEVTRATSGEARLNEELKVMKRRLVSSSEGLEKELQSARQTVQWLEQQVQELHTRLSYGDQDPGVSAEVSMLQKDSETARRKETEYLQREATHKDTVRELKQNVSHLERQVHEMEISRLAVDTPKSSTSGSARKTELLELRRQLIDAQQQLKGLRAKSKESERSLQRRLLDSERQAQAEAEAFDQQRDELEASLSSCRADIESHISKNSTAERIISRLRLRIKNLETSLLAARLATTDDQAMAEERKDLHEMLKDAKLSAEELQLQIASRQSLLDFATSREQELRAQLKRIREERNFHCRKCSALTLELESLQASYEATLDKFVRKQQQWEAEHKRVRFPNMSVSEGNSQMEALVKENDKRHAAELRGLAKQIQWLRAKLGREEGFRVSLAWEKRWLTLRCEMFEACNAVDLDILRNMGLAPEKKPKARKPPTLKVVATMVLASCRMKKWANEWSEQKKLKASLVKGLEALKGKRSPRRKGTMR